MPGPFSMFKAFGSSQSRNRNHPPPDRAGYDYNEGFPNPEYHQPIPPPQLRRHETLTRRRKEPIFTPVPSRAPTDGEEHFDGYVRVDNPQTVMGGALNARPTRPESPLSPVPSVEREEGEDRYSETFSEPGYIPSHLGLPEQPPFHHEESSRAGSIRHGSVSGRHLPDDPVTHISRSEDSGSDHTIEGPRTPMTSHSNPRMATPLPQGVYMGKTPTDIYADGSHEMRPMRHEEIYPDNRSHHSRDHGPSSYHPIPGGTSVIIQDGYGNEVARVGGFAGRPGLYVQDNQGRELYRSDDFNHGRSHRQGEPRVLSVDAHQYSSRRPSGRSYSSQSYYSVPEHRPQDDYYQAHRDRGYRDAAYKDYYRDKEYRDREYRDRGYRDKDYRDREYRDRCRDREYRDAEYRDRESRARDHRDRHHRDRDYYKRDDWRTEDRSRGSHHSMHRPSSNHTSSSRHEKQFAHPLSDDRQSNSSRLHDMPPPLDAHHVEEIDERLQSLQV